MRSRASSADGGRDLHDVLAADETRAPAAHDTPRGEPVLRRGAIGGEDVSALRAARGQSREASHALREEVSAARTADQLEPLIGLRRSVMLKVRMEPLVGWAKTSRPSGCGREAPSWGPRRGLGPRRRTPRAPAGGAAEGRLPVIAPQRRIKTRGCGETLSREPRPTPDGRKPTGRSLRPNASCCGCGARSMPGSQTARCSRPPTPTS
jgi:hypothetical protein